MREVTNQFLSNARLYSSVLSDRLKCSSVLEEVTEVGNPFQMVGAAWLKARLVNFSLFLGMHISRVQICTSSSSFLILPRWRTVTGWYVTSLVKTLLYSSVIDNKLNIKWYSSVVDKKLNHQMV